MSKPTDFGSYFKENKELLQQYVDTRLEILRLQTARTSSKIVGTLVWFIVLIFLVFLLFIFTGLVLGFWFSSLTGSFTSGFAIATAILVLIIILLTVFRNKFFVNPVIRLILGEFTSDRADEEENDTEPF